MSQEAKRDAETAFSATDGSPQPVKRRRRRTILKSQEQTLLATSLKTASSPVTVKLEIPRSSSKAKSEDNGTSKPQHEHPKAAPASALNGSTKGTTPDPKTSELAKKMQGRQAALAEGTKKHKGSKTTPMKESRESMPSETQIKQNIKQKANTSTEKPEKERWKPRAPSQGLVRQERAVESAKESSKRKAAPTKLEEGKHSVSSKDEKLEKLLKQVNKDAPPQERIGPYLVQSKGGERKRKSGQLSKRANTEPERGGWRLSATNGGLFIDQDPLLTNDGQVLILPTHFDIQVYSTKTSLLIRSFRVDAKSDITSCSLSAVNSNFLYVSSSRGLVSLWDWTTGARLNKLEVESGVRQVISLRDYKGKELILLLKDHSPGVKSLIAFSVTTPSGDIVEMETVLQRSNITASVRVYAHGSVLVASAGDKLLFGQSQITAEGQLDLSYTWREVTVPGYITSYDAQVNSSKSKTSRKVPYLDVVIGLGDGVILHYEDILFKLMGQEKKNKNVAEDITARKLHWHRTAVNTVKWSRDRNYIISGGNETVLVIWQLDSNQRQYLPHLSTPILNLAVSAAGSAYALRLGDNSVMILSTADLLPSTNISCLALGQAQQNSSIMVLHPGNGSSLLAAVPSDTAANGPNHGRISTFLQMYDLDSNIQLNRQALARNMVTASNVAPTGHPVKEPSVTHIDISHDGKWLATVDEWQPFEQDLEHLYIDSDSQIRRGRAIETSLRLWLWNQDFGKFEQVTRIDEPHTSGPNSVLGLLFNPMKLELVSIGVEGTTRVWSPKARHRNGVPVRDSTNTQLYTWSGSKTVHCNHDAPMQKNDSIATSAAMAYSEDGSVIAASWFWPSKSQGSDSESANVHPRFVHLINPKTGAIVLSDSSLLPSSTGPARLLFHTRHLLCLSSSLTIFDTITCQLVMYPIELEELWVPPRSNAPFFMARNKFDGTVAISMSRSEKPRRTKLFVLSFGTNTTVEGERERTPPVSVVHQTSFTGIFKGLLALTTGPGYLIVDEKNRTRFLRPSGMGAKYAASNIGTGRANETEDVTRSLDTIFGRQPALSAETEVREAAGTAARGLLTSGLETVNGVMEEAGSGGLDAVLRFSSSAQAPSPAELFQRVVGVLGRGQS